MNMPFSIGHINLNPRWWFDRITAVIFGIILVFIALGMILGTLHLFRSLLEMMTAPEVAEHYLAFISNILTLFILIELSRSLVDYFSTHRLRMTFIVDAGIVFVLREVMIKLFQHTIAPAEMYAISALLAVLGALRIGSVLVFQREKQMLDSIERKAAAQITETS